MKYWIACIVLLVGGQLLAQPTATFKVLKHNFGKIPQNKPSTFTFDFVNTGSKPLIVEIATAECGCTKPDYPKEPIINGKTGHIKVTFEAPTPGVFTKGVQVKFAGYDLPIRLEITGEVLPTK